MSASKETVNWRLTVRALLILAAVVLALNGVFAFDRVDCQVCWKDLSHHFFAFFGGIAAFGYAIGWTLPEQAVEPATDARTHNWNTREGFWEGSLALGALMTASFVAMHLLS